MSHNHDHHGHLDSLNFQPGNRKAFVIGICLNLAFVLAEVTAGLVFNSMALLTDAGHNMSDVASLVLSLVAFWMAKKKSTPVFTYGYKKHNCDRRISQCCDTFDRYWHFRIRINYKII